MQEAIEKASTLIEALEWIRRFRDKITVIKLGGSVMGDEDALRHILIDIVFMETVGMRPVLVHGGGNLISEAMREAGIEPRFVQGRRYTDEATLKIVEEVLACQVNERLAAAIEKLGGRAMNLNFRTSNVLTGERIELDSEEGPLDLGYVGRVTHVDRQVIENLCYAGTVPVIPSMCMQEDGQQLNVNGNNLLNCSDILTSQNNYGKVTSSMSTYFNSIIENAYTSTINSTFPGRYQGNCKPSGSQPKGYNGLNEQGVHHVAMGWYSNKAVLYVDTCIESTGQATSKTFDIIF